MKSKGKLSYELTRFYTAELIYAIDYILFYLEEMRKHLIVHRDIKPGNLLLDSDFHLKLVDFGESKELTMEKIEKAREEIERHKEESKGSTSQLDVQLNFSDENNEKKMRNSSSFVGTPLYVSPEMLNLSLSVPGMDLWAVGCIIYEMLSGVHPFQAHANYAIYESIMKCKYEMPKDIPSEAADIIKRLLVVNPFDRLGGDVEAKSYNTLLELKAHPFFEGIDFANLKNIKPPIKAGSKILVSKPKEENKDSSQEIKPTEINPIKQKKFTKWYHYLGFCCCGLCKKKN